MKNLILALFALTTVTILRADDVTLYKINNRWQGNQYLYDGDGQVKYGTDQGDSYLWSIEDKGTYQLIRNKGTGKYVSLKGGTTDVETIDPTLNAASQGGLGQWNIDTVIGDWKSIQSISNKDF